MKAELKIFPEMLRRLGLTLSSALLLIAVLNGSIAVAAPTCGEFFSFEEAATQKLNRQLLKDYPQLSFLTRDPDRFFEEMQQRFEKQKAKDPAHPHDFDFSEFGLPLVHDLKSDLSEWITDLTKAESDIRARHFQILRKTEIREINTARTYARALLAEADGYLAQNGVSYKAINEFAYFYSRLRGLFDARKQNPLLRLYLLTDDLLNGYKQLPIEQEYALYQRREFRVFQKQSFIPGGFRDSEVPFEAAFGDKDRLNMICLPSNAEVDRSFFMRLLSRNIYLIGVTKTPILADGILRPSGRFATHDIRHSAGQYAKQLDYLKKSGLSRKNFQTMHGLMDQWLVEMNFGISAIRDPALKEAVELQAFNFNHDRGFPLIPSVYLDTKFDNVSLILYYFQKTSGEGVPFDQPMKNLKRADEWLRKFWQGRLSEERTKLDFLLSEGS